MNRTIFGEAKILEGVGERPMFFVSHRIFWPIWQKLSPGVGNTVWQNNLDIFVAVSKKSCRNEYICYVHCTVDIYKRHRKELLLEKAYLSESRSISKSPYLVLKLLYKETAFRSLAQKYSKHIFIKQ
jgi:hypothetical protein